MDALKKSVQAKGRTKLTASVRDKLGKGRERHTKVAPRSPPRLARILSMLLADEVESAPKQAA